MMGDLVKFEFAISKEYLDQMVEERDRVQARLDGPFRFRNKRYDKNYPESDLLAVFDAWSDLIDNMVEVAKTQVDPS